VVPPLKYAVVPITEGQNAFLLTCESVLNSFRHRIAIASAAQDAYNRNGNLLIMDIHENRIKLLEGHTKQEAFVGTNHSSTSYTLLTRHIEGQVENLNVTVTDVGMQSHDKC